VYIFIGLRFSWIWGYNGEFKIKKEGDGGLLVEKNCSVLCTCVCVLGVFWLIFYCGLEYEVATSQFWDFIFECIKVDEEKESHLVVVVGV